MRAAAASVKAFYNRALKMHSKRFGNRTRYTATMLTRIRGEHCAQEEEEQV